MAIKAPKIKAFEVMAVIPTGQYANLQPKLVIESDNFEEAYKLAMPHIERISHDYGQEGVQLGGKITPVSTVNRETVTCYVSGTVAYFDPIGHTYVDENGNKYMSGSVFAGQFEHEFNKAMILPKSANKLGISEQEVDDYWTSKGDISTTFGTALHKALEHYGKYKELCDLDTDYKTGKSKGTGIHPTLLPIVEAFFKDRADEQAIYEPFVADAKNMRCGFIDRLVIVDATKKIAYIDDYKTNGDLYKKGIPANLKAPYSYLPNVPLSRYMIQLSFYKVIMEAAGWTIPKLRIHHWAGNNWETIEIKSVEIDVPQEKIDLSLIA